MANNYGMVNLEKVQASLVGNIESVKHTAILENGMVCNLGTKATGEREIYNVSVCATATLGTAEVLLIASPEVMYEANTEIGDFYTAIGKPARAYHMTIGDTFTISEDMITGTPVVGQYAIPANGVLTLAAAADLTGNTRFACQVVAETTIGYDANKAWRLRVVKA